MGNRTLSFSSGKEPGDSFLIGESRLSLAVRSEGTDPSQTCQTAPRLALVLAALVTPNGVTVFSGAPCRLLGRGGEIRRASGALRLQLMKGSPPPRVAEARNGSGDPAGRSFRRAGGVLRAIGRHEVIGAVLWPFVVQRTLLVGLVFAATRLIPVQPGVQPLPRVPLIDPWVRWDSAYYLIVAMEGYGPNPWVQVDAFFPAYPWMVRVASWLLPVPVAAFVVANLCALAAMIALYYLVSRLEDQACGRRSVWVALLFPSSFFLTAAYGESTYLAALIGCVLSWHHRRQDLAAACAMVATLARPIGGLCVFVPFVVGWFWRGRQRRQTPWFVLGVPVGAGLLLFTHHLASGDPLAFLHTRDVAALGGPLSYYRSPESWWAILLDEGAGASLVRRLLNWSAIALVGTVCVHLLKRKEIELALIAGLTVALPLAFQRTLFDAFGMARYALVAFPVFLVLARWAPRGLGARSLGAGFAMLQVILAVVFASWRWGE